MWKLKMPCRCLAPSISTSFAEFPPHRGVVRPTSSSVGRHLQFPFLSNLWASALVRNGGVQSSPAWLCSLSTLLKCVNYDSTVVNSTVASHNCEDAIDAVVEDEASIILYISLSRPRNPVTYTTSYLSTPPPISHCLIQLTLQRGWFIVHSSKTVR